MTQQDLLNEFFALPPEAQRQVLSFIAFLRHNYALTEPSLPTQTQTSIYPLPKFYGCIQDETFREHLSLANRPHPPTPSPNIGRR